MTRSAPTRTRPPGPNPWMFASAMLIINGIFNIANGITMITNGEYYEQKLPTSTFESWGAAFLLFAAVQIIAGILAWRGVGIGRMLGIFVGALGATLWMFVALTAPISALIGIGINVLVVWDLTKDRPTTTS